MEYEDITVEVKRLRECAYKVYGISERDFRCTLLRSINGPIIENHRLLPAVTGAGKMNLLVHFEEGPPSVTQVVITSNSEEPSGSASGAGNPGPSTSDVTPVVSSGVTRTVFVPRPKRGSAGGQTLTSSYSLAKGGQCLEPCRPSRSL